MLVGTGLESFEGFLTADIPLMFTQEVHHDVDGPSPLEIVAGIGPRGGKALRQTGNGGYGYAQDVVFPAPADLTVNEGYRIKVVGSFAGNTRLGIRRGFLFAIGHSTAPHIAIVAENDGTLSAWRWTSVPTPNLGQFFTTGNWTFIAQSARALSENAFYSLRLKALIAAGATGAIKVVANALTYLDLTNIVTKGDNADLAWNNYRTPCAVGQIFTVADHYIADGTGAAWADIMPALAVDPDPVNLAGDVDDWVPNGDPDPVVCVETIPPDRSTFVETDVVNAEETFGHIGVDPTAVFLGASLKALALRALSGDALIQLGMRASAVASHYPGGDLGVDTDWRYAQQQLGLNPITGAAWVNAAAWNAALYALKKTL